MLVVAVPSQAEEVSILPTCKDEPDAVHSTAHDGSELWVGADCHCHLSIVGEEQDGQRGEQDVVPELVGCPLKADQRVRDGPVQYSLKH